jgi:hypothetical protein
VKALLAEVEDRLQVTRGIQEPVVVPRDFKFFVYLCAGEVAEVAPAGALKVTGTEVLFLLGDVVVARIPREKVYFAARERVPVPVLF